MDRFNDLLKTCSNISGRDNKEEQAIALKTVDAALSLPISAQQFTSIALLRDRWKIYEDFERELRAVQGHGDLLRNKEAQKLFGFRALRSDDQDELNNGDEEVRLLPRSPLYKELSRWNPTITTDVDITVREKELRIQLGQFVKRRLHSIAQEEEKRVAEIKVLKICYNFALTGQCRRVNCPQHHYKSEELTKDFYVTMLNILLTQFNIMFRIQSVSELRSEKLRMQRSVPYLSISYR